MIGCGADRNIGRNSKNLNENQSVNTQREAMRQKNIKLILPISFKVRVLINIRDSCERTGVCLFVCLFLFKVQILSSSLRRKDGMSLAQWSSKYSIFRYLEAPPGLMW